MRESRDTAADAPSERERVIARFRSALDELEREKDRYFSDLLAARPSEVTPEFVADLQAKADDLHQSFRKTVRNLRAMWEMTEPPWWTEVDAPRVPMDD